MRRMCCLLRVRHERPRRVQSRLRHAGHSRHNTVNFTHRRMQREAYGGVRGAHFVHQKGQVFAHMATRAQKHGQHRHMRAAFTHQFRTGLHQARRHEFQKRQTHSSLRPL